jgi:single-strand DNA-binding protein
MNNVNLIGRLTRDPELIEAKGGTSIANFAIAVNRRDPDQDPVYVEVKAFAGQADAIASHKSKGDEVAVEGRLELDRWEAKDGSKRSRLYVVANRVEFLRNKRGEPNGADPAPAEPEGVEEDIAF